MVGGGWAEEEKPGFWFQAHRDISLTNSRPAGAMPGVFGARGHPPVTRVLACCSQGEEMWLPQVLTGSPFQPWGLDVLKVCKQSCRFPRRAPHGLSGGAFGQSFLPAASMIPQVTGLHPPLQPLFQTCQCWALHAPRSQSDLGLSHPDVRPLICLFLLLLQGSMYYKGFTSPGTWLRPSTFQCRP